MSTAKSSLRAKEIGLRKVSGASKQRLVRQYLSESFIQTFISVILAFLVVILLLNKFNDISGKDVALSAVFSLKYIVGMLGVAVFTGILAGLYPAFYLSSFNPSRAIKENSDSRKGSGILRRALVLTISVSVVTIFYHSLRSARLNPVLALRHE